MIWDIFGFGYISEYVWNIILPRYISIWWLITLAALLIITRTDVNIIAS